MRIIILTQNENLYLPKSLGKVCAALKDLVVCIVTLPAMSTQGGLAKGFVRHCTFFGLRATATMTWRALGAKTLAAFSRPSPGGPFYSIRNVAEAYGIPHFHMSKVGDAKFQTLLSKYQPELLVSMSCPQLIGKKTLDRIPMGCLNVHGAPLPRYRGLMPAFWALLHGETCTASTVHDLTPTLDDGDILVQREVAITPDDTWHSLVTKTKEAGAEALIEAVRQIESGTAQRRPNPKRESTYFSFPRAGDRKRFLAAGKRFF